MTKIKNLHRRWSRNDDYRAAYDGLEQEFRLARALIEARSAMDCATTALGAATIPATYSARSS